MFQTLRIVNCLLLILGVSNFSSIESRNEHIPLRVTRRNGKDFVVISAEDWEREQKTLHILQNASLVQQIAQSTETHHQNQGYSPTKKEVNEILSF